ncbi:MAG: HprK-related kinase A [Massilia sp.]
MNTANKVTTVGALSRAELGARLAGAGIALRTGAFVTRVKSPIGHIADGIALLYADYPLIENAGFADFHINMLQPGGLRRWFRPQVRFDHDGDAPFKPLPVDQAFPMFEWILNWCVSSRANRYLIIHAAVVERDGHAVIMPAPPGSGKSTLCAALVTRGWRLLSDELALIGLDDRLLVPLPRPISLKNASIEVIGKYAPGAVFSRAVSDTNKGTVAHLKAPADSIARAFETARPAWIVFPKYVAGAPATLAPIAPARAFMRVAENAFNYSLLGARGFDTLGEVIAGADSYDFSYSVLDEAVALFSRLAPPAR